MKQKILLIASGICGLAMSGQAALLAHYKFDEAAAATVAVDQLGANSGTIGASVTTGVAGISGNSYQFSYTGSNPVPQAHTVDMGNASFFSTILASGQLTLSAWVKTADTTGNRNTVIYAGSDTVTNSYVDLGVAAGQTGHLGEASARNRPTTATGGPQDAGIYSNGVAVNDDEWHHLVMTVDVSSAIIAIYVDGELANSGLMTVNSSFPDFNNFEIGRLGRYNSGASPVDPFNGLIDDVQVYSTALSANDIGYLFANPGSAIPEPSALALAGLGLLSLGYRRRA